MISRPEDTVACEVLPGERAAIFQDALVMVALGLDDEAHLQFQADGNVSVAMVREADPVLVFIYRPWPDAAAVEFARIKHIQYEPDDTRAFVQVFPIPHPREAGPAE